jgi:hypothetical protein
MREGVFNGPGIVFDPVAIRRVQKSLTSCAKPPEKSKRSPNQAGKPDQAKVGRVNESESSATRRKRNRSSKALVETMMNGRTRTGVCDRLRLKNTEDLGV